MAKMFPFCTLCWFWLDFRSDLSLYICRYILDVYALFWLVLDREHCQTSRRSVFLFCKGFTLSSEQEGFPSAGINMIKNVE